MSMNRVLHEQTELLKKADRGVLEEGETGVVEVLEEAYQHIRHGRIGHYGIYVKQSNCYPAYLCKYALSINPVRPTCGIMI